jgi:FkbM family methyltransferase
VTATAEHAWPAARSLAREQVLIRPSSPAWGPVGLEPVAGLARSPALYTHDPATDLVSARLWQERAWEPFETRLWLRAQRDGDTVIDVGANLGYFSLLSALAQRGAGRIVAFEPAADNFALLTANLQLNACRDRVDAVQAALGACTGPGTLQRSEDNRGDHQTYRGDGERQGEAIRVLSGAEALAERVDHIDLLKIDTQGSEADVVAGLWPLLEASRRALRLLIELTPFSLALAGSSGRTLVERLAGLDLPMAIVDHVGHVLVPSDAESLARWCDNVAATPGDRGFMNVFVGHAPVS